MNNRLLILGAGESGVGAALLGQAQGWDVFVSDGGKLKDKYKEELEAAGIAYEEGGHTMEKLLAADCCVKSPGIPEKAASIKAVHAAGIEVVSEIEFAFRYKGDSKLIAITGSNGKSTTTKLIHHLLVEGGLDAALVGNIGYSFARQIAEEPKPWYVIEVSSFQLDYIRHFRPDIGVLLNITPDHLDRYDYRFENYIASKFRIAENMRDSDVFVVNADDAVIQQHLLNQSIHARKIPFTMKDPRNIQEDGAYVQDDALHIRVAGDEEAIIPLDELPIAGQHNQYNSMAAGISARVAGLRSEKIRQSFSSFEGLEHRLENVRTVGGVHFINDSKATNVNSTWFALESMKTPTVLIMGGQDKGNDYGEILDLVKEKVKAIVCLGLDNTPIHAAFDGQVPMIEETDSADAAVQRAYALAEAGDTVLLSPACASFDLFTSYEDRGRQFKEAVNDLV
jgi:UDP-N-acetylmuramoylalanine--D-glutamate ligase